MERTRFFVDGIINEQSDDTPWPVEIAVPEEVVRALKRLTGGCQNLEWFPKSENKYAAWRKVGAPEKNNPWRKLHTENWWVWYVPIATRSAGI